MFRHEQACECSMHVVSMPCSCNSLLLSSMQGVTTMSVFMAVGDL